MNFFTVIFSTPPGPLNQIKSINNALLAKQAATIVVCLLTQLGPQWGLSLFFDCVVVCYAFSVVPPSPVFIFVLRQVTNRTKISAQTSLRDGAAYHGLPGTLERGPVMTLTTREGIPCNEHCIQSWISIASVTGLIQFSWVFLLPTDLLMQLCLWSLFFSAKDGEQEDTQFLLNYCKACKHTK